MTLGCARNEVDSEELAGRLDGRRLPTWSTTPTDADAVVVNTCGFVEAAKKDSVDTLLAAADLKDGGRTQAVVAVGCLAERYGEELADVAARGRRGARLRRLRRHRRPAALDSSPASRTHPHTPAGPPHAAADHARSSGAAARSPCPATATAPTVPRPAARGRCARGSTTARWPPLKLASGCDRRCTFCAIPSFRGSFVSRRPGRRARPRPRWLAEQGVRELFLVSENSTSYGKDLGDLRLLETLLPELAAVDGVERVRVVLPPAGRDSARPGRGDRRARPGVAPYFDLSFQHASGPVLRRMRRFGDPERFLDLLEQVRALAPEAGVRSNVIVGFPGETEDDLAELERLPDRGPARRRSASSATPTRTAPRRRGYDGKLDEDEIRARVAHVTALVEELTAQRAEERIGERGRGAGRRGPVGDEGPASGGPRRPPGPRGRRHDDRLRRRRPTPCPVDLVAAVVVGTEGVDLVARALVTAPAPAGR